MQKERIQKPLCKAPSSRGCELLYRHRNRLVITLNLQENRQQLSGFRVERQRDHRPTIKLTCSTTAHSSQDLDFSLVKSNYVDCFLIWMTNEDRSVCGHCSTIQAWDFLYLILQLTFVSLLQPLIIVEGVWTQKLEADSKSVPITSCRQAFTVLIVGVLPLWHLDNMILCPFVLNIK